VNTGMGIAAGMKDVALARQHPAGLQEVIGNVMLELEPDHEPEEHPGHRCPLRPPSRSRNALARVPEATLLPRPTWQEARCSASVEESSQCGLEWYHSGSVHGCRRRAKPQSARV